MQSSHKRRLKYLREISGMSRIQLSQKHGISYSTLCSWENSSRNNGNNLSEGGAKLLCQIFQAEGVRCNVNWLLNGTGSMPENPQKQKKEIAKDYKKSILKIKKDWIAWTVDNSYMGPDYEAGNVVFFQEIEPFELLENKAYLSIDIKNEPRFSYVLAINNSYLLYDSCPRRIVESQIIKFYRPISICI